MTIYFNDARDYSPIIEKWVNEFRDTLEDDPANGGYGFRGQDESNEGNGSRCAWGRWRNAWLHESRFNHDRKPKGSV